MQGSPRSSLVSLRRTACMRKVISATAMSLTFLLSAAGMAGTVSPFPRSMVTPISTDSGLVSVKSSATRANITGKAPAIAATEPMTSSARPGATAVGCALVSGAATQGASTFIARKAPGMVACERLTARATASWCRGSAGPLAAAAVPWRRIASTSATRMSFLPDSATWAALTPCLRIRSRAALVIVVPEWSCALA
jgi:hypothetical protein